MEKTMEKDLLLSTLEDIRYNLYAVNGKLDSLTNDTHEVKERVARLETRLGDVVSTANDLESRVSQLELDIKAHTTKHETMIAEEKKNQEDLEKRMKVFTWVVGGILTIAGMLIGRGLLD